MDYPDAQILGHCELPHVAKPYTGQYFDIINAYRNGSMAKQEVPKGVAVDAATKTNGTKAGQASAKEFGEQFVEVICKHSINYR